MRIYERVRGLGTILNVAAVVAAVVAYILSAQAGKATGTSRTVLLVLGALLAGITVALGALQQLRSAKRETTAAEIAVDAEEGLTLTLNGALAPITDYLGEMANAGTAAARATIGGQLRQAVVDAAVKLTAEGSRSAFYAVDASGRTLIRQVYAGRSTQPREEFVAGTPDGDAVLDVLARRDLVFITDVEESPMVTPSTPDSYRTVIGVAVTAGTRPLGLLTVDALAPGDLSTVDVELVRVLANLLGCGLAQASARAGG